MQMKRKVIFLVFIFFNISAFASTSTITCPSPIELKKLGNQFLYIYFISHKKWMVISNAFIYQNRDWQIRYTDTSDSNDSAMVLKIAQETFNRITLLPPTHVVNIKTECHYKIPEAKYDVVAVTPATVESWLKTRIKRFLIFT